MSTELKVKVFESCAIPVVIYGAQMWAPTRKQLSTLSTSRTALERAMIGIKKI